MWVRGHFIVPRVYTQPFAPSATGANPGFSLWGGYWGGRGGENGLAPPPRNFAPPGKKVVTPPSNFFLGGRKATGPTRIWGQTWEILPIFTKIPEFSEFWMKIVDFLVVLNFFFLFRFPPPQHGDSPPQIHPPRWGGEIKKFAPPAKKA